MAVASTSETGIVHQLSHHSVEETLARLERLLVARGVTVFALVDHSGEAAKVGISMLRPTLAVVEALAAKAGEVEG